MNRTGRGGRLLASAALGAVLAAAGGCIVVNSASDEVRWSGDRESDSPWIGVELARPPASTAAQAGVHRDDATLITRVIHRTPADLAGLQRFDVVVGINGRGFASREEFRRAIRTTPPGETVRLLVARAGERIELEVVPEPRHRRSSMYDG